MRRGLPWKRTALALASALLLAGATGCGGSAAEPPVSGALPASDVNPLPRDQIRTGGTLRWPLPEFPMQWNFHHINGSRGVVDQIVQAVLPYLMRSDAKGVPHPVPAYLRSAEVTRTKPRQVVTYRLNPDARWSDGRRIGLRDFVAQARALSGQDRRFQVSTVTGYGQIAKVEQGENPHEIRVVFRSPYADWRSLFSPLYPAATCEDPEAFNNGWLGRVPVSAGPFRVAAIDQTAKTVALERDPGWWGRPAKLDRIVFRAMDTSAMPGAFANDEIDLMDIGVDAAALRRVENVRGAAVRRAGGPDWRHFTLNAAGPVLSDARVRRAVMMGIDRRAIARSDLADLGWPVQTLGNHFFVNTQAGYRDNSGELGRYDPRKAARLLDEAGWRLVDGRRVKDGRPMTLRFVVPSGVPGSKQEGELTRALLDRLGIGVEIEPVPTDDLFDRYVTPGDFDIVPFSWLGTAFPLSPLRSVFARPRGDDIQQNYSRLGSDEIDAAMDRAIAEIDPARARRLVNEADRLIWKLATVLPLYQRPQIVATRGGLANLGAGGFLETAYEDIGFTGPRR